MVKEDLLEILKQGAEVWNKWRKRNPEKKLSLRNAELGGAYLPGINFSNVDLSRADLEEANLYEANLRGANLREARLTKAILSKAILSRADIRGANFRRANLQEIDFRQVDLREAHFWSARLFRSNLSGTNLTKADLRQADLRQANLIDANLTGADLSTAILVRTNLIGATLTGCSIYGISAWGVELAESKQQDLVITPSNETTITVDNLEIAQFVYLLLNNKSVRDVIDTVGKKAVLILGRFTPRRKAILDALRNELRKRDFLPILFDFERPTSRNLTETVSTLAHMARFVIADITEAKSIPQELGRIIPMLPSVPVQPIVQSKAKVYAMFDDFYDHSSVLELYRYENVEKLLGSLEKKVIAPAVARANEVAERRKARQGR